MPTRAFVRIAVVAAALSAVVFVGQASYSSSSLPDGITVVAGDTLWGIATANGLTVQQLAAANNMSPSDLLLIGRHLVIPTSGGGSSGGSSSGGGVVDTSASVAGSGSGFDFCADTSFYRGTWGVLPWQLQNDPGRLALRPLLAHWAEAYGVAPALVEAVAWQESGWQEGVTSSADAIGVGQLLPGTADFVSNDLLGTPLSIYSTNDNIRMMSAFLAYLIRQVGNSPCRVAAAYYQGPAALASYGVFPETEQYVRDILALEPRFE